MERPDLTFRVFVSSTFSDLIAERNALHEHVFPRLREFCQKNGARFQAIDLRWGVSEEAALDQSTMRICRAEIARCQSVTPRPNFVILLGDRHGWRPLPDEIPAAEFEALLPHLPAELANSWYRLDENAVCPLPKGTGLDKGVYVLQPRTGEFKDYETWFDAVEGPLGDAFRCAARQLGLPEDARRKYEASATAQEIYDGAFAKPEASEHVVAFIREIRTADGRPLREALPCDAALKDFVDLKKGTHELDCESLDQLDALKQRLHDRLGTERVKTYNSRWERNGARTEHIQQLCEDVYATLEQIISSQIEQHTALSPLEDEKHHHQEFARRRSRDFTGQSLLLSEIGRYLLPTSEPSVPLVVHGMSGAGKSALLAKAVIDLQLSKANHKLIFRFIGATANSTDPRTLLEGLCHEIGELYGADNSDLPMELNKLVVVFHERLELATAERPLILFLDALDQLQVSDRPEFSLLPDKLPGHVHLVVSTIPGPIFDSLRSHLPSAVLLELGRLDPDDATVLFQKWLQRAGRLLSPEEQWQAIQDGFTQCPLPLYLRLVFEEAQLWRSYDKPPPPSPDVDGLIERLFHRLSEQLHHEPLLVERAISYLRCSRYGLSEDEILDLLANDPQYWERFLASAQHALPVDGGQQTRRLPIVIWSRLYHDLEPYLSWRSVDGTALMVFFHTRFNEVADRQFLLADTVRSARHDALATYFRGLADPLQDLSWSTAAPRPIKELVYQVGRGAKTVQVETGLFFHAIRFGCSQGDLKRHPLANWRLGHLLQWDFPSLCANYAIYHGGQLQFAKSFFRAHPTRRWLRLDSSRQYEFYGFSSQCVAISPSIDDIAVGSSSKMTIIRTISGETVSVPVPATKIRFSRSGKLLGCISEDAGVTAVIDVAEARVIGQTAEIPHPSDCIFSPDEDELFVVGQVLAQYSWATNEVQVKAQCESEPLNCVALTPDGNAVAAGNGRHFILWDSVNLSVKLRERMLDHLGRIRGIGAFQDCIVAVAEFLDHRPGECAAFIVPLQRPYEWEMLNLPICCSTVHPEIKVAPPPAEIVYGDRNAIIVQALWPKTTTDDLRPFIWDASERSCQCMSISWSGDGRLIVAQVFSGQLELLTFFPTLGNRRFGNDLQWPQRLPVDVGVELWVGSGPKYVCLYQAGIGAVERCRFLCELGNETVFFQLAFRRRGGIWRNCDKVVLSPNGSALDFGLLELELTVVCSNETGVHLRVEDDLRSMCRDYELPQLRRVVLGLAPGEDFQWETEN
jgi:hypothetical protein